MATLNNKGESIVVDGLTITVGEEYVFFDNFVKVLEIQGAGRCRSGSEVCVVESRFGSIAQCESSELYAKPVYKKPLTSKARKV